VPSCCILHDEDNGEDGVSGGTEQISTTDQQGATEQRRNGENPPKTQDQNQKNKDKNKKCAVTPFLRFSVL
jgi:hypothetical protein